MKHVVYVADTHVGHVCGLWHPNAVVALSLKYKST
jgi:hypothetical protein